MEDVPTRSPAARSARKPPRRLSLVDIQAASANLEHARGSPLTDSGFIASAEGQSGAALAPVRSPSFVYHSRFSTLNSPSPASPSHRLAGPASPSSPISVARSQRMRRSESSQRLSMATRATPSGTSSRSVDNNHESSEDHTAAGRRSSFAYNRSASWYANAPASQGSSSQADEPPRAKLSSSASSGSLRGVGRRYSYTHMRGKSDSTGNRSPMIKAAAWASPSSNADSLDTASGETSSTGVIRRQGSRGVGMSMSRSSGSLRTTILTSTTPEIDWKAAISILEGGDTSSSGNEYASTPPTAAATPEAFRAVHLADPPRNSWPNSGNGNTEEASNPVQHDRESSSSSAPSPGSRPTWTTLPPLNASPEYRQAAYSPHPGVSRSATSTSIAGMSRAESFVTGRESLPGEYDTDGDFSEARQVQSGASTNSRNSLLVGDTQQHLPHTAAAQEIGSRYPIAWSGAIDGSAGLETLAEVASTRSGSGGTTVRSPPSTASSNRGPTLTGGSTTFGQRRASASSASSSTSLPLGFGQSLRNYFADYFMSTGFAGYNSSTHGGGPEQAWIRNADGSNAPSEALHSNHMWSGRPSTRGTIGDQTDGVNVPRGGFDTWRAHHQGSSSVASGVLPFPTDVISGDGHATQKISRDDREYLSGLSNAELTDSGALQYPQGESSDAFCPGQSSSTRRQRSSDPLIPPSRVLSYGEDAASPDEMIERLDSPSRAGRRSKRWSDIMRDAAVPRFAEQRTGRSGEGSPTGNGTLPSSGRSSRTSRHSLHSLVPGPSSRRFTRLSGEINTRDESSPLSFFGPSHHLIWHSPPSSPPPHEVIQAEDNAGNNTTWPGRVGRTSSSHTRTDRATNGRNTPPVGQVGSNQQGVHHRFTSETLREHRLQQSAGDPPAIPSVHGAQYNSHEFAMQPRLTRYMCQSSLLRGLCRFLSGLVVWGLPALWYVFEAAYLFRAISPAIVFPPIIPLLGAWGSYLAILIVDPGYVPKGLDPEPVLSGIAEKQLSAGQAAADRGTGSAEDEDPAIAALDKDSPRRKMALAKLREQLLKAVASPPGLLDPKQPDHDGAGEKLPSDQQTGPNDVEAAIQDPHTSETGQAAHQTTLQRFLSASTNGLSPIIGPSAPPASPATAKLSRKSTRRSLRRAATASHPDMSHQRGLPNTPVPPLKLSGLGIDRGTGNEDEEQSRGNSDKGAMDRSHACNRHVVDAVTSAPIRWCPTCKSISPPRSVHCQGANRCVADFHYYSFKFGRAIGRGNVLLLFAHLASSAIFALYAIAFSIVMLAGIARFDSSSLPQQPQSATHPPGIRFSSGPYASLNDALKTAPFAGVVFLLCILVLVTSVAPELIRLLFVCAQGQTLAQHRMVARQSPASQPSTLPPNTSGTTSRLTNLRTELFSFPPARNTPPHIKDEEAAVAGL